MQTGGLLPDMSVEATVKMISATMDSPRPVDEVLDHAALTDLRKRALPVLECVDPGLEPSGVDQ